LQTDFGPIRVLTMESNTLCTADIEQCKMVTIGVAWVVAASFVLWTVRSEFMTNIKMKNSHSKCSGHQGYNNRACWQ